MPKFRALKSMLFAFTIFLLPMHLAAAEQDFLTEYSLLYDISDSGDTTVTQDVTITNLKNDVIVQNYTLRVKQLDIYDIKIHDKNRDIEINEEGSKDETTIKVTLNSYNIGEGRQNNFSIIYKSKDIANKVGEIWNINIPRTQAIDATTGYNIRFSVPQSFGQKIFITPVPILEEEKNGKRTYYFTKDSLSGKNITAAFGNYQYLNFRLRYQIDNPNLFSSIYEIPLPPDIKMVQQVKYSGIKPEPQSLYVDDEGNSIARYKLKPKEKLEVEVIGNARISGRQIDVELGGRTDEIPSFISRKYTDALKYWEADSAVVKEIGNSLFDKDKNIIQNAQSIYTYLIENHNYDFETLNQPYVDRKGAQKSLEDNTGWACMEFTDTFIAIARSVGIPAREINGYALSSTDNTRPLSIALRGGDLLHAWPEFYDPHLGWIQIDPTWGDTSNTDYFSKLDTNHFVFVIKGSNSEYPLPPGTYRFDQDHSEKLVEVEFTQNPETIDFTPNAEISRKTNFNLIQLLLGRNRYSVKNTGKVYLYTLTGNPIPPGMRRTIYYSKESEDIKLMLFNNEEVSFKIF